jgi:hypothetical protein
MSHLVPSLSEPVVKLDRAREHFATLRAELQAFMSEPPHPYAIVAQKYPDGPVYALRLKVFRAAPVRLGLLVGDFAHNARASLDYLARQLSLLAKPELAGLPANGRLAFPNDHHARVRFRAAITRGRILAEIGGRVMTLLHQCYD